MNVKNFVPRTLQFVKLSGAFCKKAIDELNEHRKKADAAEEKRAGMLEHLKTSGVIDETQTSDANTMLGSHAGTMDLLKGAVDRIVALENEARQKQALDQGSASGDPMKAADDPQASLVSPFVGQRTSQKKASDHALLAGLGIPTAAVN